MSARAALLLLALLPLGACATKRDVRELRTEVAALREAQDSSLREMQRANRAMLDSLSRQGLRTRGDVLNRIGQMEGQLSQVREMTGQGQQELQQLREQLRARERELEEARRAAAAGAADTASTPAPRVDPEELFNTAMESFRRGSMTTARAGFQEFLRANPQHRRAGEALFYVGETYAERDPARAIQVYAQVVRDHATSSKVPAALYRAGTLEAARGNRSEARTLFSRVVQNHPRSPEAELARQELRKLRQ